MSAPYQAVVIGVSAGAVEALSVLLPSLPHNYPLPIFIVVHLPPDRPSAMVDLFAAKCGMHVKEAEDKETIRPGTIYFAPPDYHLLVERTRHLSLSSDEPVLYSRPAIDVLFESAADAYRETLIGIVLTGANADGSQGLKAVVDAGGAAFVQTPNTAYAAAMPQAALRSCPSADALDLTRLSDFLKTMVI